MLSNIFKINCLLLKNENLIFRNHSELIFPDLSFCDTYDLSQFCNHKSVNYQLILNTNNIAILKVFANKPQVRIAIVFLSEHFSFAYFLTNQ